MIQVSIRKKYISIPCHILLFLKKSDDLLAFLGRLQNRFIKDQRFQVVKIHIFTAVFRYFVGSRKQISDAVLPVYIRGQGIFQGIGILQIRISHIDLKGILLSRRNSKGKGKSAVFQFIGSAACKKQK